MGVDAVIKEQFMEVLPEGVRVWVKEHKPDSSETAGCLAGDYRQAKTKQVNRTHKKGEMNRRTKMLFHLWES